MFLKQKRKSCRADHALLSLDDIRVRLGLAPLGNDQLINRGSRTRRFEAMVLSYGAHTGSMCIHDSSGLRPRPTAVDTWGGAGSRPSRAALQHKNYRCREPALRGISIFENRLQSLCFCEVLDEDFSNFLWAQTAPPESEHTVHSRVNRTTSRGLWHTANTHNDTYKIRNNFIKKL